MFKSINKYNKLHTYIQVNKEELVAQALTCIHTITTYKSIHTCNSINTYNKLHTHLQVNEEELLVTQPLTSVDAQGGISSSGIPVAPSAAGSLGVYIHTLSCACARSLSHVLSLVSSRFPFPFVLSRVSSFPLAFHSRFAFHRPTQSIVYVPSQVKRSQKCILLTAQYKYIKSCSGDFYSPESDPPHKIMWYWVYYSTKLVFGFPPDRSCQAEMICIGGVPVLKRHFGGAGP